jgi:hypothetical protein
MTHAVTSGVAVTFGNLYKARARLHELIPGRAAKYARRSDQFPHAAPIPVRRRGGDDLEEHSPPDTRNFRARATQPGHYS